MLAEYLILLPLLIQILTLEIYSYKPLQDKLEISLILYDLKFTRVCIFYYEKNVPA